MVDKRIIEQVLAEQYEELVELQNVELCTRKEEAEIDLDSNLAQVVIGVRRSGKSTSPVSEATHDANLSAVNGHSDQPSLEKRKAISSESL